MTQTINLANFYKGKRILVTGGAGFIGSHLVEMLVEMGALVTVLVRKTTSLQFLHAVQDKISLVEADLFESGSLRSGIQDQQIVIHMAAAKGGGIVHSMCHHGSLFRDNMLSFINILDWARDHPVDRFLVVSSACVYPRDATVPTPEEDGVKDAPEPTNAGYGWSKRMEEYLGLAYAEEYGMNVGVARPFNAYGPRDDFFQPTNHVIPGLITRLLGGESPLTVWGTGQQTRAFLYVEDFARGLLDVCAHYDIKGPLNIGPKEEITIAELAKLIVKISGLDVDVVFNASKPDGQPRRSCDTSKAYQLIGYQSQVALSEGLARTIDWYRTEKQIRGNI